MSVLTTLNPSPLNTSPGFNPLGSLVADVPKRDRTSALTSPPGRMPMLPNSAVGNEAPKPVHTACAELADRLWAGEDCRAEDFIGTLPATESGADAAVELIYTEFVVREELGQHPAVEAWLARFPEWRDRLERM